MPTSALPKVIAVLVSVTAVMLPGTSIASADASAPDTGATVGRYRLVVVPPLGTNSFGAFNDAVAVNRDGVVVGSSSATNGNHAYKFEDGKLVDLGTVRAGFAESTALGLNDYGVIVGSSQINGPGDTGQHAYTWAGGTFTDLGTGYADRRSGSYATGINNTGMVIGTHYAFQGATFRAVKWVNGVLSELPDLGGGTTYAWGTASDAYDVNSRGDIVGDVTPPDTTKAPRAVRWRGNVMTDLGNLGGTSEETSATSINDAGAIAGVSQTAAHQLHAFIWRNGVMTDLGTLSGASGNSFAHGINNSGVVVGTSDAGDPDRRRAVAFAGGRVIDLNRRVKGIPAHAQLRDANAINDNGIIVADMDTDADTSATVLLIPLT